MTAEGMQFPWRWNGGTISPNLGVIWEMSVHITKSVRFSPIKGQIVIYRSSLGRIRLEIPFVLRFPTTSGMHLENFG